MEDETGGFGSHEDLSASDDEETIGSAPVSFECPTANEPTPPEPTPRKVASDRYRLGAMLGEGGMARVYVADDTDLDRSVAVKCLRDTLAHNDGVRRRFFEEARVLGALDHPGVIPVFETGVLPNGDFFYAMKQVRGRTLKALLDERDRDQLRSRHNLMRYVDIFERICQTMAAAHVRRIIHRDLKPANIMVDELNSVYVVDWGLAKRVGRPGESTDAGRTRVGDVMGTPAYMAPEQAQGKAADADCQSDVFSLGVMLYEILTGSNPFFASDAISAMKGVMFHDPENPRAINPRVSRDLSAVCMKCLNKDPFKRYPSASELADDIRRFREFRPVSAAQPRMVDRLVNWSRRRPVAAAIAATLALVLCVGGVAVGVQASVENALVAGAYRSIDRALEKAEELGGEIQRIETEIRAADDPAQRSHLKDRLLDLQARRHGELETVDRTAWGILGFSVFSPDARAQELVRANALAEIDAAIDAGELSRADVALRRTIQSFEQRNLLGLAPDDVALLRLKLESVEKQLAERGTRHEGMIPARNP